MILGYATDLHLGKNKPRMRVDLNWMETQQQKLNEILSIFKEHQVEMFFGGGDLFEEHSPGEEVLCMVLDFHNRLKDIGVRNSQHVVGNHDTCGRDTKELERTGLGVLFASKLAQPLIVYEDNKLAVHGVDYADVDQMVRKYHFGKSGFKILVMHGMILPLDQAPFDFVHPDNFKTDADLVLLGHYHYPFAWKSTNVEGKPVTFINQGAVLRVKAVGQEVRPPCVTIVDTKTGKWIQIQLKCAIPNPFAWQKVTERKEREGMIKNLQETLTGQRVTRDSIRERLLQLGDSVSEPVKEEAIRRLDEAVVALKN